MKASEYQLELYRKLSDKFPTFEIRNEWAAFSGYAFQYSPRVDIAFGPFSTTPGHTLETQYNELIFGERIYAFLSLLHQFHIQNIHNQIDNLDHLEIVHQDLEYIVTKNQNSRCLLAIEIENTNSKKHMMGSIINAASLGRVGIGIAFSESAKRTFIRILNYLAFLKRVGKNTYDTTNFLIVTTDQFDIALFEHINRISNQP